MMRVFIENFVLIETEAQNQIGHRDALSFGAAPCLRCSKPMLLYSLVCTPPARVIILINELVACVDPRIVSKNLPDAWCLLFVLIACVHPRASIDINHLPNRRIPRNNCIFQTFFDEQRRIENARERVACERERERGLLLSWAKAGKDSKESRKATRCDDERSSFVNDGAANTATAQPARPCNVLSRLLLHDADGFFRVSSCEHFKNSHSHFALPQAAIFSGVSQRQGMRTPMICDFCFQSPVWRAHVHACLAWGPPLDDPETR